MFANPNSKLTLNCWFSKLNLSNTFEMWYTEDNKKERKLSRSRDWMLFFISLLWGTRKPEKLWLQQFSNHPISKLRSFQMLWAIQTSWDSLQWVLPRLQVRMKLWKAFFTVHHHVFPSLPSIAYPGTMQSGHPELLDIWSVIMQVSPPSHHPVLLSFSFHHVFRCIT